MNYVIRPAKEEDGAALYNISRAAHRQGGYEAFISQEHWERFEHYYRWSKRRRAKFIARLTKYLADPSARVLVATAGGQVVGYTIALSEGSRRLVLKSLFVRPRHQGRGIGKALFQASYASARPGTDVVLEVLGQNLKARTLYERQGFRQAGVAPTRYFGGELVLMTKHVD